MFLCYLKKSNLTIFLILDYREISVYIVEMEKDGTIQSTKKLYVVIKALRCIPERSTGIFVYL